MSNNELHAVIKELKEFKLLKEEAEARISELESIVKSEMRSLEAEKLTIGEYKCSLATVTSNRIDSKALQEKEPAIYTAFLKTSSYTKNQLKTIQKIKPKFAYMIFAPIFCL